MSLYRRFHDRFGAVGVALGTIALILALGGTALAAGALTGKQKKEVEKIAKKFAGKPGAPGATGPAGPQGPAGANGKDGADGQAGANGKDGISPAGTTFAGAKGACSEGGVEYKGATTNLVCNGKAGEEGEPGAIHPGETLPSGASETGSWGAIVTPSYNFFDVSFNLPLASTPELVFVKTAGVDQLAKCPGITAGGIPQANAGSLCVYRTLGTEGRLALSINPSTGAIGSNPSETGPAGPTGAAFRIVCINEEEEPVESCAAAGVWAVTAP